MTAQPADQPRETIIHGDYVVDAETEAMYWKYGTDGLVYSSHEHRRGPKSRPIDPSYFSRVKFTADCWLWLGRKTRAGYGMFKMAKKNRLAHRLMYLIVVGPVPGDRQLDHLCDEPSCVRPDHLRPATAAENNLRSTRNPTAINARKTHCIRGHLLSGDNLQMVRRGPRLSRGCRECRRLTLARYRARRKAGANGRR